MKLVTPLTVLWVAILCIFLTVLAFIGAAFEYCDYRGWIPKNPVTPPRQPSLYDAGMTVLVGTALACAAVMLLRYRKRLRDGGEALDHQR